MSQQTHPQDITQFSVTINGYDVTPLVTQCDVFQELFTPTWSAQLMVLDTQNIIMNIPVVAGNTMTITMGTQYPTAETKVFDFVIHRISDRIHLGHDKQGFRIGGITRAFFTNQRKRVQKSYRNQSASAIVGDILKSQGLGQLVDQHTDKRAYTLIVPNMSPFAAINWVSRFAMADGADYWLYQSDSNEFKFHSYDRMRSNRTGITFKQINPNIRDRTDNLTDDHFYNIENYEFVTNHDSMSNVAGGYYGSTVISHDIHTKTVSETEFHYGDDIPADLEFAPFDSNEFKDVARSNITFNATNSALYDPNIIAPCDTSAEWIGSRKSNIMKMESNRLLMTVAGVVSHYKLLGSEVHVELPSNQTLDDSHQYDKYLKGSYVVTAVRHTVLGTKYKCTLELGKKQVEEKY